MAPAATQQGAVMTVTNDPPLYTQTVRELGHDERGRCVREGCETPGEHMHSPDGTVYDLTPA
jgi:hypothetical protein